MHTIIERKATKGDFQGAEYVEEIPTSVWGCAIVGLGLLPMTLLGIAGRNLYGIWGLVGGLLMGAAVFATLMYVSWRQRKVRKAFMTGGDVQEVSVECSVCFEIDLYNCDPILAVDIGLGKILILQGQWLTDAEIYGLSQSRDDPVEEYFNGLPKPNCFPNSRFTIVRDPVGGGVFAIRPSGNYLSPEIMKTTVYPNSVLQQSQLISGSADNLIADILANTDLRDGR